MVYMKFQEKLKKPYHLNNNLKPIFAEKIFKIILINSSNFNVIPVGQP